MYYYIFDPPQGPKEYERTSQIKEQLSQLGIAGEMAAPQPGRSAEDLVHMAITKRYSTVVAVGGIDLINKVARTLEPYDAVLGIIPTADHPDIANLIGTNDWKSAAEQLKRRRWQHVRLGYMNNHVCFLTPATLNLPTDTAFAVQTADFTAQGVGGTITITPVRQDTEGGMGLICHISPDNTPKKGFLKSIFNAKDSTAVLESTFALDALDIQTSKPVAVDVAGTTLLSTPVRFTTKNKGLRLIVAKAA